MTKIKATWIRYALESEKFDKAAMLALLSLIVFVVGVQVGMWAERIRP